MTIDDAIKVLEAHDELHAIGDDRNIGMAAAIQILYNHRAKLPYLHPILAASRGTPAYEEEKAALAVADRPRGTYVPFTVHEIDLIRACLDDGTYTAQERQDIGKLCDMAISSLLYAEEIQRLRDRPVSATRESVIKECADRLEAAAEEFIAVGNLNPEGPDRDTAYELANSYDMASHEVRLLDPAFKAEESKRLGQVKEWLAALKRGENPPLPDFRRADDGAEK